MRDPLLLVVGSVNYDLIFTHRRLPAAGETVTGATLHESCGGKGANQAVAAARCAGWHDRFAIGVAFAGAVGADGYGAAQRRIFEREGIDARYLQVLDDSHTGLSSIWVEAASGENRILNSPGANAGFLPEHVDSLPMAEAGLLLVQNEVPPAPTRRLVERAAAAEVPVIWNPAPLAPGEEPPIEPERVRFVTPNEVEAAALLGRPQGIGSPESAVEELIEQGYGGVVLTLGRQGAVLGEAGRVVAVAAPAVTAVDTTGAGDAFNGAFAAALIAGFEAERAVRFGVAFASDSVTRPGTQTALPRQPPAGW